MWLIHTCVFIMKTVRKQSVGSNDHYQFYYRYNIFYNVKHVVAVVKLQVIAFLELQWMVHSANEIEEMSQSIVFEWSCSFFLLEFPWNTFENCGQKWFQNPHRLWRGKWTFLFHQNNIWIGYYVDISNKCSAVVK